MNATITNAAFELRGRIAFEHQRLNRTFLTRNGARMTFAAWDGHCWRDSDRVKIPAPREVLENGRWQKVVASEVREA